MDPTDEEETMASSLFSILFDHDGVLCGMNKLGGDSVEKAILSRCVTLAHQKGIQHGQR